MAHQDTLTADSPRPGTLDRVRQLLVGLVVLGAAGLVAELLLLGHWESATQRIPLILLVLTVAAAIGMLAHPARRCVRAFRVVMLLAVISGFAGTAFHYQANDALEREIAPDRPSGEIFVAAIQGGVPTLAPGAMIQLGLLGLIASLGYPARRD